MLKSTLFRRVTIVGVGLMGGSIGLAIKKHGLAKEVVGLSYKQSSLVNAIRAKSIDIALTDIPKAIRNSDLVILAAPVESIIKLLSSINPHLKRGCMVTDVGSAKTEIVESAEKILSNPSSFVGSHPLVGSEKKGADYAQADLFEGSRCIMTPTSKTNRNVVAKVKQFWVSLGAKVTILPNEEHDEILAYISHLPHLLAFGLMEVIPDNILEHASNGLRDTTRIAASSPQMWNDICLSNSKNLIRTLDEFVKVLSKLRKNIIDGNSKDLIDQFTKARDKRNAVG